MYACDVMKLCNKFEHNQAIRGGVIAISIFNLMNLKRLDFNPTEQENSHSSL